MSARVLASRLVRPLGLVMALLLGAAPAFATDPAERELPPPEEIAAARDAVMQVLADYQLLARHAGDSSVDVVTTEMLGLVPRLADEDASAFVPLRESMLHLSDEVRNLDEILFGKNASAFAPPVGANKSTGFPNPTYSAYCGDRELSSDALFAAMLVFQTAKLVRDTALRVCNQAIVVPIPLGGCVGGNARLACIVTDTIFNVADITFGELKFCAEDIEGNREQATYDRMQHIHDDLQKMAEDLDFIRKMLTCVPVLPLKVRSGCNGTDDDCDTPKVIDECEEDVFGPSVYIQPAIAEFWYPSMMALRQAAQGAVIAMDDCQSVSIGNVTVTGSCDLVVAEVTATDACGNATTATLQMKLDPTPPQVTIPPSLAGTCFSSVALAEATVRAQAIIADDCTPLDKLNVRVDSSLEGCELRVRIEATNLAGHRTIDATTVRVDPHPPLVEIDRAIALPWYQSMGEATAALIRATHVSDDCHDIALASPQIIGTCGSIVGTMTATDDCGNTAEAQVTLHVDSTPPTVSIPAGLANACYASVEAAEQAVRAQAIVVDDCTPRVDLALRTESALAECRVRVTVIATDLAGLSGSAGITLRVDPVAPTVTIDEALIGWKGDPLSFQTPRCFATAAAAEAAVLEATNATDNCTAGGAIVMTSSSSGNPCNLLVTARGTDACGLAGTDTVTVRVDTTAPTVTCSVVTNRLTPSDNRWVDVGLSYSISDTCTTGIVPVITVTSDESPWNGGTSPAPDAEILPPIGAGPMRVRLRAEATSPGDGRVYRIQVRATDACGNSGTSACIVNVPNALNQQVDSGQYYDAAVTIK